MINRIALSLSILLSSLALGACAEPPTNGTGVIISADDYDDVQTLPPCATGSKEGGVIISATAKSGVIISACGIGTSPNVPNAPSPAPSPGVQAPPTEGGVIIELQTQPDAGSF
jgi:hypothetical protein